MKRNTIVICLFLLAAVRLVSAQEATLFQKPTVNRTHVVFVYAGDLWSVPRAGGEAVRLTTGIGAETDPQFSPDGTQVAFTGQYDGNTDVFVMPATGGVPKRLTWHPGIDVALGWTPDGKRVLFASARDSVSNYPRLYTLGLDGGLPEALPLPRGERGAFSPDGAFIVYEPQNQWTPEWKRYRGGQMDYLWIAKLSDSTIEKLPRAQANDRMPMWVGDKVFFLSDRDGKYSLYAYDTKSKKVTQAVRNDGMDVKSASADAASATIAYEQFGTIHLYDIKTSRSTKVAIKVNHDLLGVRPRFEKVGTSIADAAISPTGARAVFEARGEIVSVPAEKGDARNLTNTPGAMERDPAWSPDGKWIAYFSDAAGEYELHLCDQKGAGEVKKIKLDPNFYYNPTWSPDSKKLAFSDHRNYLYYVEIEKGAPVKVDRNPESFAQGVLNPSWSPDSRWLAYVRQLDNHLGAVFVYALDSGKAQQITDGMSDAQYPAFDKNGKHLYFTASTNLGPTIGFIEMSSLPYQPTRSVYAVVLRNDLPSPLAPESDEEKVAEEKKDEGEKKTDTAPAAPAANAPRPPAKKEAEPVRIDFDGIDQRIVALPQIPARNYVSLQAGKANLFYLLEVPQGATTPGMVLHKFDLEKRKLDRAGEGILGFAVAANGEKALLRQGPNWLIANTATLGAPLPPGAAGGPNVLKIAEMEVQVDPRAEWQQMYNEVWRGERDFFYDRNLHGLDLEATKRLYAPYLKAVAHRADLNYLFTDMLNQLTVGHMFIAGGDVPRPNFVAGGLLGADYSIENGRYRFTKVYNGESWNPSLRAPLTQPGVNVKAGEYLLAVKGRNVTGSDNLYQLFESTAGKQVVIKVGPNPDGTGARDVTVVPVADESALRNRDWVESNRRKVDELSGGKLAYVYMPDTGLGGYTSFNRYFYAQTHKQGAVIDERFNNGGYLADHVIAALSRPLLSMVYFREGRELPSPLGAIYGPKAMLINEWSGSGGDALPWLFRKQKIGPTIGKRTHGALIASQRVPTLMDGGFVTAPDAAFYGLNGEWEVENAGIPADFEVEWEPVLWRQGRDAQLEKAVTYLLDDLKKNPPAQYKRPAFPNYHKAPAVGSGN